MMALTGIVFSLAFVMVQFSATAYSPRLVLLLARDPVLYHSLGAFIATFCYAIVALAWVDRHGSGKVPLLSTVIVILLLVFSIMLFARLVQRLSSLQITRVLQTIGKRGRQVVRETFPLLEARAAEKVALLSSTAEHVQNLQVRQVLYYLGEPRAVAAFDVKALVRLATAVRFYPYAIPVNCIPSVSRYMTFPDYGKETEALGVCASRLASAFFRFYGEKFEWPNFLVGNLKLLPWPQLTQGVQENLAQIIKCEVDQRRLAYQNHEPFYEFLLPLKVEDYSRMGQALAFDPASLLGGRPRI